MKRKRIRLFKLTPIRRSSRKIGRNEPCPCGRTKDVYQPASDGSFTLGGHGEITTECVKVRMKYKHCHGNEMYQKKAKLVKDKMQQYFYDLTHSKPKKAKLAVIVDKLKEAFSLKHFGRK